MGRDEVSHDIFNADQWITTSDIVDRCLVEACRPDNIHVLGGFRHIIVVASPYSELADLERRYIHLGEGVSW